VKTYEFIQGPGEMVFIPGGWWHAVLNVDNTMAVTQNFMSKINFPKVWTSLRQERKKFSCKFLTKLNIEEPELHKKAIELNNKDGFVMYDNKVNEKRKNDHDFSDELAKKKKDN